MTILMISFVSCHFLREFPSLESVRRMKVLGLGFMGAADNTNGEIKFNYSSFPLKT